MDYVMIPDIPAGGGLVNATLDLSPSNSVIFVNRIKDLVTKLVEHRQKTLSSQTQIEGNFDSVQRRFRIS
jgi:hypothetical protein